MPHKSLSLYLVIFVLLAGLSACEQFEQHSSERLIFNVSAEEGLANFGSLSAGKKYIITADDSAFISQSGAEQKPDSIFIPTGLVITIFLPGDLTPSLLSPNGYQVNTQITLEGGTIVIDHTNQASPITTPEGDSLYAIRGEGIVSSGGDIFKNISGFFFEESTYGISPDTTLQGDGKPRIHKIACRYELIVDF
jgi:hypothetical protein